VQQNITLPYRI